MSTVAGVGDIQIAADFVLKNVLHVPKLSANLVPFKNLQKTYIVMLFFVPFNVNFRTRVRGGRLDMLRRKMDFITLTHRIF